MADGSFEPVCRSGTNVVPPLLGTHKGAAFWRFTVNWRGHGRLAPFVIRFIRGTTLHRVAIVHHFDTIEKQIGRVAPFASRRGLSFQHFDPRLAFRASFRT